MEEPAHAARRVVSVLVKVTIVEGEPPWPEITSTDVRRKHFEIDTMLSILFSHVIFVFVSHHHSFYRVLEFAVIMKGLIYILKCKVG